MGGEQLSQYVADPVNWVGVLGLQKGCPKVDLDNPSTLYGKSHKEIEEDLLSQRFQKGSYKGSSDAHIYYRNDKAGKTEVTVNYGGGRHSKGAVYDTPVFYKVAKPNNPKTKVIDPSRYPESEWVSQKKWKIIDGNTGGVLKEAGF
jgi:hypothetical protein